MSFLIEATTNQPNMKNHPPFKIAGVVALSLASALPGAISWNGIQFGGFASQGYLVNSGDNNYLGKTSEGTFDFREYAANVSWAKGDFRVGAQVFGQKLGEYGDDKIALDWASIDYQPTQWFGLRAGRVKMPRGLYNEALDVDAIRPFVLLPQSVYDARLRDFNAAFNGGMVFGNLDLGGAGSLDYKVYYGDIPMDLDSGAAAYFNNDVPFPNTSIGMDSVTGGSVFWNTPASGLRVGYSLAIFNDFAVTRVATVPGVGQIEFLKHIENYYRHLFSAEYFLGDWTFAAEFGVDLAEASNSTGLPQEGVWTEFEGNYLYVSASRRLGEKFEVGAYYSYSREDNVITAGDPGGVATSPPLPQHDYAVSLRYDITYNWLVKAEVHYLHDAGKIFTTPADPQPYALRDQDWFLFALKTTVSF